MRANEMLVQAALQRLPDSVKREVMTPPQAGEGVHGWLWITALELRRYLEAHQIVLLLRWATRHCGRVVPERELRDAVNNSRPVGTDRLGVGVASGERVQGGAKWPDVDHEWRQRVIRSMDVGVAGLISRSPVKYGEMDSEAIIDALFPGNPLICVGTAKDAFFTKRREWLRGWESDYQLVVPNPMSAVRGLTQAGKLSERSMANTGPRKYLVIESDIGTLDEQAALLCHLELRLQRLTMVVFSGRRSLQGWYYCAGVGDDRLRPIMAYAVRLGADPATWTRCQMVRMPGGVRRNEDGKTAEQMTLYFDINYK